MLEHITVPFLEAKAVDDEAGVIEGYGSVFGNVDQGQDIVMPGAFKGALAGKVKMLWQHDPRQPIGVWTEMTEDAKGLKMRGQIALKTAKGAEAYELLKMGAMDGLSIGYRIKAKGYEYDSATNVRKLKALDLMEVSVVTFPMNTRATVARVKSATSKRELEASLRDAGLSASEAKYVVGLTSLPPCETPEEDEVPTSPELKELLASLQSFRIG
jgi:HK97 family phage prohead protease